MKSYLSNLSNMLLYFIVRLMLSLNVRFRGKLQMMTIIDKNKLPHTPLDSVWK